MTGQAGRASSLRRSRRGRFITLEGGEGTGKSTQVARLRDRLLARDIEVITTREPGGSPRAEQIREVILSGGAKALGAFAETLLFAAARADHVDQAIRPALMRGAFVICDRFADSTRVYQGSVGAVPARLITSLERIATGDVQPDLTLMLDLSEELGLARAAARRMALRQSVDRFEAEDAAFHKKVRRAFLAIAEAEPNRCAVIPATGSTDDVESLIWDTVEARLLSTPEFQHPGAYVD